MEKRSLGLIETWGYIPAMEAADAAAKAANVVVLGYEEVRAGLVTVRLVGDVAAVQAAVCAGQSAAGKVGLVISAHVIARPDRQLAILPSGPQPGEHARGTPPQPAQPPSTASMPTPGAARKASEAKDTSQNKPEQLPPETARAQAPAPDEPSRKTESGTRTGKTARPKKTGAKKKKA